MLANRLALVDRKLRRERFVGQQREHRLLVRQLRTEAVHDADLVIAIRLHQRMIQREAQQEFLHADAPVDQVDLEIAAAQHAVAILQLLGRDQFGLETFGAEIIAIDFVFAAPGGIAELENRDVRLRLCPANPLRPVSPLAV